MAKSISFQVAAVCFVLGALMAPLFANPLALGDLGEESGEITQTCDSWTQDKMEELGVSFYQLAAMIMEGESTELSFEFIMYCLMDESPNSDRPNMLRNEIAKMKFPPKLAKQ